MTEIKKYLLRFGIFLLIFIAIIFFLQGFEAVKIVFYKISVLSAAFIMCELFWLIFFKKTFGKAGNLSNEKLLPVLLFRGILYGSIILAVCLGL